MHAHHVTDCFITLLNTPDLMLVVQNYHKLYRRPRGMYFDATDKGEMVRIGLHSGVSDPPGMDGAVHRMTCRKLLHS